VLGVRSWSLPSVYGSVALHGLCERRVPDRGWSYKLQQLRRRDCVGIVGCVRLDDVRRVQRRNVLGGRCLGLRELLDGDLLGCGGECVLVVRRWDLPNGHRGDYLRRLRGGDLQLGHGAIHCLL